VVSVNSLTSYYPDPTAEIRKVADAGYNVIVLTSYLSAGPSDMVSSWSSATDLQRQDTLAYIHKRGASLLMGAAGPADSPYNLEAADYASTVASFALENDFDGVEFSFANFSPGLTASDAGLSSAQVINWLSTCFQTARTALGPNLILSAAPEAQHFGVMGCSSCWAGTLGGMTAVEKRLGYNAIDFYNVLFYNAGALCYTTETTLMTKSCSAFPQTSVMELASAGLPLDKLVIGKPTQASDCSTGLVSAADLNKWMNRAKRNYGWFAGVMAYQWHGDAISRSWLQEADPPSDDAAPTPTPAVDPKAAGGALASAISADDAPNPLFVYGIVGGSVVLLVVALVGFFIYKRKRPSRASLAFDNWAAASATITANSTAAAAAASKGTVVGKDPKADDTSFAIAIAPKDDGTKPLAAKVSLPSALPPAPKQPFPLPQPQQAATAKATAPAPMSPALSPRSPPSSDSRPTPVIPRPIIPVIRALPNSGASSKLTVAPALRPVPALPTPADEEAELEDEPEVPQPPTLIAANDFTASDDTELSFNQGDKLTVIDASPRNAPGWLMAHVSGQPSKRGLVPGTYF
jgi:chitinase